MYGWQTEVRFLGGSLVERELAGLFPGFKLDTIHWRGVPSGYVPGGATRFDLIVKNAGFFPQNVGAVWIPSKLIAKGVQRIGLGSRVVMPNILLLPGEEMVVAGDGGTVDVEIRPAGEARQTEVKEDRPFWSGLGEGIGEGIGTGLGVLGFVAAVAAVFYFVVIAK